MKGFTRTLALALESANWATLNGQCGHGTRGTVLGVSERNESPSPSHPLVAGTLREQ
jgi:hypothetical protein